MMVGSKTRGRGELEEEIMRILWESSEPMAAGDIQEAFPQPQPAYTTLLTVLSRLEKKTRVTRLEDSPRKVRFQASRSEEEHASTSMLEALADVTDRQATLMQFAGNLSTDDVDFLRDAIASRQRSSKKQK